MLTVPQLQTLKTWLLVNATQINEQDAAIAINTDADPVFYVYRTAVPMSEIMLNGFDWTRVDNLSNGKARIWDWMFSSSTDRAINPSKANVRAGINAVWVGTQADLDVRDAVYAHCYRAASIAEKLLATGTGTAPANDGDGSGPAVMGFEGDISAQDVVDSYNAQ